jgi:hypothetical protein
MLQKSLSAKKTPVPHTEEKYPRKKINIPSGPSDDDKGRAYANFILSPELAAYRIVRMMQPKNLAEDIDTPTILELLRSQAATVKSGDLGQAEAMLINQASALQALFVRLCERSMQQEHLPNLEGLLRLALRAQSQCRATLEALAIIKSPPMVYARQANVTTGPQQINNTLALHQGAQENRIEQNQLLEDQLEQRMDSGAAGAAGVGDSAMAALGQVNRT